MNIYAMLVEFIIIII